MRRKEVDLRFDEIVEFSGVEQFLETPVKRYSSGMYVRLAFGVAAHLEPEIMLVEAMAQFAGGLVFESQGFISGIDACEVTRKIETGDVVIVHVSLEADFGGTFRFSGTASIDGVEVARGRFYLASSDNAQT